MIVVEKGEDFKGYLPTNVELQTLSVDNITVSRDGLVTIIFNEPINYQEDESRARILNEEVKKWWS